MDEQKQLTTESWDGFLGSNWLSADDLKIDEDVFACVKAELDTENGRPLLHLEKEEISYKFGLNVTNSNFCKDAGIKAPKDLVGKKITFRKSTAYSPSAKKDVPTLRISHIE